ncbi:hypothetical protein LX36DRAFT_705703, partial [Colletotrichum falcatum]
MAEVFSFPVTVTQLPGGDGFIRDPVDWSRVPRSKEVAQEAVMVPGGCSESVGDGVFASLASMRDKSATVLKAGLSAKRYVATAWCAVVCIVRTRRDALVLLAEALVDQFLEGTVWLIEDAEIPPYGGEPSVLYAEEQLGAVGDIVPGDVVEHVRVRLTHDAVVTPKERSDVGVQKPKREW